MITQLIALISCGIFDRWRGTPRSWLPNRVECALFSLAALFALLPPMLVLTLLSNWMFTFSYVLLFVIPTGWGAAVGAGLGNLSDKEFTEKVKQEKITGEAEYYLVGPLARSWKLALIYRGFQWGFLPSLALAYFVGIIPAIILTLAFTISMPGAVLVSNAIKGSKLDTTLIAFSGWMTNDPDRWAAHELIRGWMVGTILILATSITDYFVVSLG